jgi:hypothetical protein
MNVNKLPEHIDEIGAFYKKALNTPMAQQSTGSYSAIMAELAKQKEIKEEQENEKKKISPFFHPQTFKIAASLSSIVITSVIVLASTLAVVTVVYDHVPNQIKIFNTVETEVNSKTTQPKTVKQAAKAIKDQAPVLDELKNNSVSPQLNTENQTAIQPQNGISEEQKSTIMDKEPVIKKVNTTDNKKLLEELKEDDLFK